MLQILTADPWTGTEAGALSKINYTFQSAQLVLKLEVNNYFDINFVIRCHKCWFGHCLGGVGDKRTFGL